MRLDKVFSKHSLFALHVAFLIILAPTFTPAQGKAPDVLYKEILPSVVILTVEKADGSRVVGSAFLALDNKVAVTSYSLVDQATSVVATFSSGEVFDVSGIIDKDEKRDLALIRIKVFGGTLLDLESTDPPIGSRAYLIGSPEGSDFTITDGLISNTKIENGVKSYKFTCPAASGNIGGAIVNDRGKVIGIVSSIGTGLHSAAPSVFALGLDTTLPTHPWPTQASREPQYGAPARVAQPPAAAPVPEDFDPTGLRVQFYIAEDLKTYNNNRQLWIDTIQWWVDRIKENCSVEISNVDVKQNDRQSLPPKKSRFTTKLSGWESWIHGEAKLKEHIGKTNSPRSFHLGLFKELRARRDEKWFEVSGHHIYPNVIALKEKTTRVEESERVNLIGHLFGLQAGDGGVMSIFYPRGPDSDPAYGNLLEWSGKWCGKIEKYLGN